MKSFSRIFSLALLCVSVAFLLLRESSTESPRYLPKQVNQEGLFANSDIPLAEGATCVDCHAKIVEDWQKSQHANANRLIGDADLSPGESTFGDVHTRITEDLELVQKGLDGFEFSAKTFAVIGVEALIQPLVLSTNGRIQVFNPAYNVETNGWFNAFTDVRNFKEWGHWSGRGMNWNVQCAWCHMTAFKKNYDPKTDSYDSEWKAMAISCSQCHGDLSEHAANPAMIPGKRFEPEVADQNCMTCHARRGFLTPEKFKAGDNFNDHFQLTLMDRPNVYYPDGQVRDENFETGSYVSSKMHDAGVSCQVCHNPHSGELTLPVTNNALCMSCHTPPGRVGATPIMPMEHSHHGIDSTGNRCVECHMPETEYMQSDLRRDHGFTVPDPLITRTLGIPNACNRCHSEESQDWAEKWAEEWYGEKLAARRTRPRANAIQDAWDGAENLGPALLQLAQTESNINWRASLIRLMRSYISDNDVREFVQTSLNHDHELVRINVAWTTRKLEPLSSELATEVDEWLTFNSDQPAGALQMAQMALSEDDPEKVELWVNRLLVYDGSAEPHRLGGQLLHAAGMPSKAGDLYEKSVQIDPESEDGWYVLGMLRNELGNLEGAMDGFRRVVLLNPNNSRAWYNLGLAHIQGGNKGAGLLALKRAEDSDPDSADAAYATATVYLQDGNIQEAQQAMSRALQANPTHGPTLQLFERMQGGR